ncbi:MAG: cardiolipin synthase [Eubacteriales bacterium]|nr:cardiolipin synthase [Eubacteriales bacterium]
MEQDKILLLEKGKRGLLRMIFGRTGIIIGLLAVQVLFLLAGLQWLASLFPYLWALSMVVAVGVVVYLIGSDDNPAFKLSWMLLMLVVPIFGILLYLYVKTDLGHRAMIRRFDEIQKQTAPLAQAPQAIPPEEVPPAMEGVARYLGSCGFSAFQNTETQYFPLGELAFAEMLKQLKQAEQFIFLEYFIIAEDSMWGRILEILAEKAAAGVEVRVLYDGTCAVSRLPYGYPKKLQRLGIQCRMFAPLRPFVSTHYNYRDHRKLMIIDGKVGFTGGINLTDEYINVIHPYGHWKDNGLLLRGEAVRSMSLMFLQMWNLHAEKITEDYSRYLSQTVSVPGQGWVIPYGDSPLDTDSVGELVYMDIINRAQRYVHIMTPYLILDNELTTALCFAAQRGVDVKIIMPHIPDAEIPFALAHTYYRRLLDGGVQIFEYVPGYVHAKVFVSDDTRAVVGTINLDYRSLYHHFECAVYHHQTPVVAQVEQDIQDTLTKSIPADRALLKQDSLLRKLTGAITRLIAPLM